MAHTQGPWKIEQADLVDDERLESADITAPVPGTQYKTMVARVYCENRKGATVGPNARLIAAAPELLESARGMVSRLERLGMEHYPLLEQEYSDLRAVVAKAEGGAK